MEKFKAVEKEMKTKAFSKEGLNATAKMDPKEKEKQDAVDFLNNMVEELERQVETFEAEEESLQATVKKGKKDTGKADRLSEISRTTERHKFHLGKLELLLRFLQNGNVETEQVVEIQDGIKYYVEENQSVEFMEDDLIYDDLNLEEDEGAFGMLNDVDRVSSQDTQSNQDDQQDIAESRAGGSVGAKTKQPSISEPANVTARRPSNNFKSPLPALATLHTPLPNVTNGATNTAMKPAPVPTRPPGETLKYASAAAAAAAASDKNAVGIAPLPPPPGAATTQQPTQTPSGLSAHPSLPKKISTTSPSTTSSAPKPVSIDEPKSEASQATQPVPKASPQTYSVAPPAPSLSRNASLPPPATDSESNKSISRPKSPPPLPDPMTYSEPVHSMEQTARTVAEDSAVTAQPNGHSARPDEIESVYHLPPGLQDLLQSFEVTKSHAADPDSPSVQRLLQASAATRPNYLDAEKPRHYKPDTKYNTPEYYPQQPFSYADDPGLYSKIDSDTLFYIFYYRQNTYQQYMAAKSLKSQSWRFHKQYQTWFQRHEEPKTITEEYEQGTYRFFDYESTWCVREKNSTEAAAIGRSYLDLAE